MIEILTLCLILIFLWFVFDSLAAREAANESAQARCQRDRLQFLDGTVAFAKVSVIRLGDGFTLQRVFRFEFSLDGTTRLGGFVTTHGRRVSAVDLPPDAYH
ncbi:MAG: DUF3301 domain-containing protein [Gammaproteobacteria bacterium]